MNKNNNIEVVITSPNKILCNLKDLMGDLLKGNVFSSIHTLALLLGVEEHIVSYVIKSFRMSFVKDRYDRYSWAREDEFKVGVFEKVWGKEYKLYQQRHVLSDTLILVIGIMTDSPSNDEWARNTCEEFIKSLIPPMEEKEFYCFHKLCPKCKKEVERSIRCGICTFDSDYEGDGNICCPCGWEGKVKDLIPNIDPKFF